MGSKRRKQTDDLHLTPDEAESLGVDLPSEGGAPLPEAVRELPMHEQVTGELTEDDVVEAFTGEVTAETREEVEEAFADLQEDAAEAEGAS